MRLCPTIHSSAIALPCLQSKHTERVCGEELLRAAQAWSELAATRAEKALEAAAGVDVRKVFQAPSCPSVREQAQLNRRAILDPLAQRRNCPDIWLLRGHSRAGTLLGQLQDSSRDSLVRLKAEDFGSDEQLRHALVRAVRSMLGESAGKTPAPN